MSATEQRDPVQTEPVVPLVEEISPAPDPWDVARRFARSGFLVFLDSAANSSLWSRYSFVTANPFWVLHSFEDQVGLVGRGSQAPFRLLRGNPFRVLADLLSRFRVESLAGIPPFQGGVAGLFGYGLSRQVESLPWPRYEHEFNLPDLDVGFYDWVWAYDHVSRRAWLISTGLPEVQPTRRRRRAEKRLAWARSVVASPAAPPVRLPDWWVRRAKLYSPQYPLPAFAGITSNFDREGYLATVRRAVEYIHAGDCFQVNLSQRLLHPATVDSMELYSRLRERNPAPFSGYLDFGDVALVSASPERFLCVENGVVEARPIKGTRPRGSTPAEDLHLAAELETSVKDRAENVMIVDLLRNDLGRVCQYGTVEVPAVCRLESYRTVHHLVSEVRGRLRPGLGPVDLLKAAFPGGSVTGAPKVRAMEIITELEQVARGPYCGSLGYIGFDGSMDLSILIRTFTQARGWLQFPVGGGIVADSDPAAEYDETLHKAEGMLRALR